MKIIGHRGAKGLAPENTLIGLDKALECHPTALECDIRLTSDHVPILHHDACVVDPEGTTLSIAHQTLQELRAHKSDLADLAAVFAHLKGRTPLVLHIKEVASSKPVVEAIAQALKHGWQAKDVTLASANFQLLSELHKALPELPLMVIERWSGVRAGYHGRRLGTKQICMDQRWLWWGFIRSMAHSGWQLYAYTLNDPAKARRWERFGLAGVITDYPDRFSGV